MRQHRHIRLQLLCLACTWALGCGRGDDVKPAAPAAPAVPAAPAPEPAAPVAAPPAAKPGPPADAPAKPAPPAGGGDELPKGLDAADLDPAERKVLAEILDEQFCPCGKPRSFRASLAAGDCALAPRLARFCVRSLQQGYGKRKIVGLLLREIERLNTVVALDLAAAPVMGDPKSRVKVAVFSDFECPFCRRAAEPVAKLQKHYQVAVFYLHFPLELAHPHAEGAARAAWAAHQQGKFWPMHDLLFAKSPELAWDKVKGYASKVGLDLKRFEADVASPAAKAAVAADKAQGTKVGVDGTPTFFVNGRRAETLEQLQEGIREALEIGGGSLPPAIEVGAADQVPEDGGPRAPEALPAASE